MSVMNVVLIFWFFLSSDFAWEDGLHPWCHYRPAQVWRPSPWVRLHWCSAHYWNRGEWNSVRIRVLWGLCLCKKDSRNPLTSVFSACVSSPLSVLQIFVGKIPRDLFEDELVPLFEKAGPIWDLRLMMDPLSGLNRGYAFLTFCTKEAAQEAVKLVRKTTSLVVVLAKIHRAHALILKIIKMTPVS